MTSSVITHEKVKELRRRAGVLMNQNFSRLFPKESTKDDLCKMIEILAVCLSLEHYHSKNEILSSTQMDWLINMSQGASGYHFKELRW